MMNVKGSASARLPAAGVWLERGEGFARVAVRVVRGMNRWLHRGLSSLEGAWARRAALRDLDALDDRLLADIGLRRDQVAETVDAMFRGGRTEAVTRPTRAVVTRGEQNVTGVDADNDRHYQSAA